MSRRSRMPVVGLVRLRRALEGETPFFDPITSSTFAAELLPQRGLNLSLGDTETGDVATHPTLLLVEGVQIPSLGSSKGLNGFRAGGLMRYWKQCRGARGNLAHSAPWGASSKGLWTAQACNCVLQGCITVRRTKPIPRGTLGSQATMNRKLVHDPLWNLETWKAQPCRCMRA